VGITTSTTIVLQCNTPTWIAAGRFEIPEYHSKTSFLVRVAAEKTLCSGLKYSNINHTPKEGLAQKYAYVSYDPLWLVKDERNPIPST